MATQSDGAPSPGDAASGKRPAQVDVPVRYRSLPIFEKLRNRVWLMMLIGTFLAMFDAKEILRIPSLSPQQLHQQLRELLQLRVQQAVEPIPHSIP